MDYNATHGIVPKSVVKKITDIMEGARADAESERGGRKSRGTSRVAEEAANYAALAPEKLAAELKRLEAQMYKHAQNLEFEDAARLRDELHWLREAGLR
jgi:excinuclease ABC subunit B